MRLTKSSTFALCAGRSRLLLETIGLLPAAISRIKERTAAFARGFLYDSLRLASSNRIVSKSGRKVNLSVRSKGKYHYEPIICKRGTDCVFSALFLVFALVGGVFFAPNPVLAAI